MLRPRKLQVSLRFLCQWAAFVIPAAAHTKGCAAQSAYPDCGTQLYAFWKGKNERLNDKLDTIHKVMIS